MTNKRGGVRPNAGRKTEPEAEVTRPITLTLDAPTIARAKLIGGGNISKGLRLAVRQWK